MAEPISIDEVRCIRETDRAVLVVVDGAEIWVPKVAVHDDSEVYREGDDGTLIVAEWFAKKNGWGE